MHKPMKDHIAVAERRLKAIAEDQKRLETENYELRKHGRALADYLLLLAHGKTMPDYRTNDVRAAMKALGRFASGR
jgi:hypothetical protein